MAAPPQSGGPEHGGEERESFLPRSVSSGQGIDPGLPRKASDVAVDGPDPRSRLGGGTAR